MTYPRIRVRLIDVHIVAPDFITEGVAAVDDNNDVHYVVPGNGGAAHHALEDLLDGADMYEVL